MAALTVSWTESGGVALREGPGHRMWWMPTAAIWKAILNVAPLL